MSEEEESSNKIKNNLYKTIETGTLEETVEATNDNNNKNKKNKKSIEITMSSENHTKPQYCKPKKTRLSKTCSNL